MNKPRVFKRRPVCRDGGRSTALVYRAIRELAPGTPIGVDAVIRIEAGPSSFPMPATLLREALDVLAWDGHLDTWYAGGRVRWARATDARPALPEGWRYERKEHQGELVDSIRTGVWSLSGYEVTLALSEPLAELLEQGPTAELNQWPTRHHSGIRRQDEAEAIARAVVLTLRVVVGERTGYTWPSLRAPLSDCAALERLVAIGQRGAPSGLALPDRGVRL